MALRVPHLSFKGKPRKKVRNRRLCPLVEIDRGFSDSVLASACGLIIHHLPERVLSEEPLECDACLVKIVLILGDCVGCNKVRDNGRGVTWLLVEVSPLPVAEIPAVLAYRHKCPFFKGNGDEEVQCPFSNPEVFLILCRVICKQQGFRKLAVGVGQIAFKP